MGTDRVMDWSEVIRSNGRTNIRLARMAISGMTALGLILVPGSYKLAIVLVSRVDDESGSQLTMEHYRDPGDPCYFEVLNPASDNILEAIRDLSRIQMLAAIDNTGYEPMVADDDGVDGTVTQ